METLLADANVQGLIVTAVVGVVAGALARFLIPGKQSMNIIFTMLLGIAGAYVGGYIKGATSIGGEGLLWVVIMATAGAIVVLLVVMFIQKLLKKG